MGIVFDLLFNNALVQAALGAVALILGFKFNGWRKKREGIKETEQKAREADHENASNIRDRRNSITDEDVRDYDSAGYRD